MHLSSPRNYNHMRCLLKILYSKFTLKILHQKVTSNKFCTKRSQVTNFAPKGHKYKNQKKFGCTCDLLTQNFDFRNFISSKKKDMKILVEPKDAHFSTDFKNVKKSKTQKMRLVTFWYLT